MEKNLLERLLTQMDLTGESIPGQLLVELFGNRRILIENHLGVLCYGPTEIRVNTPNGIFSVSGRGMTLAQVTKSKMVIVGCISGVNFE